MYFSFIHFYFTCVLIYFTFLNKPLGTFLVVWFSALLCFVLFSIFFSAHFCFCSQNNWLTELTGVFFLKQMYTYLMIAKSDVKERKSSTFFLPFLLFSISIYELNYMYKFNTQIMFLFRMWNRYALNIIWNVKCSSWYRVKVECNALLVLSVFNLIEINRNVFLYVWLVEPYPCQHSLWIYL